MTSAHAAMPSIAFLGMGLMGSRMASRLLAAGFDVSVWNRTSSACTPLVDKGATQLHSLDEVVTADIIMLCLADDTAITAVCERLLPLVSSGQIIIDFSSVTAVLTQKLSAEFANKQVEWLDIPVSGGVHGAAQGTLVMFAGGSASALDAVQPVLAHLASRVTHMGKSGTGQVTKLCNQLIVAANSVLIAEAVRLAEMSGVDATQLAPALAGGFADSKPMQILAPRMAARTFEPVQWKVATLHKDIANAVTHAQTLGVSLDLASHAANILEAHTQIRADDDLASIVLPDTY